MIINGASKVAAIYQQNSIRPSMRTTRADEEKDLVAVSSMAKDFSFTKKALESVPDTREDLVNNYTELIKNGTFKTQLNKCADKLVSSYFG